MDGSCLGAISNLKSFHHCKKEPSYTISTVHFSFPDENVSIQLTLVPFERNKKLLTMYQCLILSRILLPLLTLPFLIARSFNILNYVSNQNKQI